MPGPNEHFEQIVVEHQTMVFRALARLMGPRFAQDRLEDLAQTVFLRLFRALPNFRGDSEITTYLYRIAVNAARDEWKRREREDRRHLSLSSPVSPSGLSADETGVWADRLPHPGAGALAQLEECEFATQVNQQLDRLTIAERSALILFHQEERTYEQIAETLGLPLNTVRTHLHRGRKKLRDALQHAPAASERRGA